MSLTHFAFFYYVSYSINLKTKNMRVIMLFLVCLILIFSNTAFSQLNLNYKVPPKEIADLVLAPTTPRISLDGTRTRMLMMELPELPSIAELAETEIKVAGIRINPAVTGASRTTFYTNLSLRKSITGKDEAIKNLPDNARIQAIKWSPDNLKIAFTNTSNERIELWMIDVETNKAEKITSKALSSIFNDGYVWVDSKTIAFTAIPKDRGEMPQAKQIPAGPVVQESKGAAAPSRTFQDLLKNQQDEYLFEYFGNSELIKIDIKSQTETIIYNAAIIENFSASPNGNYLLISTLHRPYSYLVPYYRFPIKTEIVDLAGKQIKMIADLPLAENIPISFSAARKGRRNINWRDDAQATVYWVEAQDEGDPKKESKIRDKVFTLDAPFSAPAKELLATTYRFSYIYWGDSETAISYESWWANRKEIARLINPSSRTSSILWERSSEDSYNDPGSPLVKNVNGRWLMALENGNIFLSGNGASPEGDMPFLDKFNLKTKQKKRLWQSEAPYYERVISLIDESGPIVFTSKESNSENPNYYIRNLKNNQQTQVTHFPHPYPALQDVKKQVVQYKRADGVDLKFDLYLPPNYDKEKQGPLPGILWAYPMEYKSQKAAGQVTGSPYQFTRLFWGSPVYWVTQGYAVLNNTSIPIVGEGDQEPNDTFIEQLVAGAKAAVDKASEMGVLDAKRVGVGGHSYGAFMTANLLAHSNLFAAGIARSGAYNRTFTPFGFQAEERTYWEAPEVYNRMSPFMNANKIKTPLLLIHGDADNNPGTFPMQSERLFNAIKGNGGIVRYVNLPLESHGYKAKESILHTLWEQHQWLEQYVKSVAVPLIEKKD
jgi:dipeptidyl aminopeptidase/acylaminoacyl peptidase